ncbi:methionine synthase [Amycolatopsis echigonensis]|uniref:Methionine synthase n=1 Tax=Amycolatopsis echigonensis TaxID=2576905 RepID=A0A2N3WBL0_9PSEU|nr:MULTISPECIES: methionine synthase [Amycolatopsis]MBB2500951.1 methionine synthase [Amycolatopsis echigonensis]PKV91243.1 cobalamin-independent methionine synthase catalytic subunit [Amycolatopsis niigatensis]
MSERPWPAGAATGIGSMPGTDPVEAAAVVFGELPGFPYVPELPARGVGADMVGRTAALLVDLAIEVVPSGYRVAGRPGHDHRRGRDLLQWDLDAVQAARENTGAPTVLKTQIAGPWTLGAGIELARGHRVLTDRGALRDFTSSLLDGLSQHVAELTSRTDAPVVVQLDEPSLPAVLAGSLSTPSGYGNVPAVPEPEVRELLATTIERIGAMTGQPVIVHCCAPRPPIALFRAAGAGAVAFDISMLAGASAELLDEIGEAWDSGISFFLGLVPATDPVTAPGLKEVASPALRLVDRLGFNRSILAERAVPTPACGLAGATNEWMRRALALSRDLGKAFVEPPENW